MIYQTGRSTVGKKFKLDPGERVTELEDVLTLIPQPQLPLIFLKVAR